jgi:hypothetical protein
MAGHLLPCLQECASEGTYSSDATNQEGSETSHRTRPRRSDA